MTLGDNDQPLKKHRELENEFHRDIMNCCRKYLNHLGIISVIGIMELAKLEVVELEKASKTDIQQKDSKSL